jgi:hypothetical protein
MNSHKNDDSNSVLKGDLIVPDIDLSKMSSKDKLDFESHRRIIGTAVEHEMPDSGSGRIIIKP